jgi:hypothetical protein
MFGSAKQLTTKQVEEFLRARGLDVRSEAPSNPADLVRFAYLDRGVPFWLTLSAYNGQIDGLTFFTAVQAEANLNSINAFNGRYKFSKAYLEGGSTCCTMSNITNPDGFDADFLEKNFALWELALPAFGEMIAQIS